MLQKLDKGTNRKEDNAKIRYAFNRSKSLIFFVLSSAHLRLIFG